MNTDTIDRKLENNRGWLFGIGIVLMVVGLGAIAFPVVSSIAVETVAGAVVAIGGLARLVHSFGNKEWSGFFLETFAGLIWLIAGAYLLLVPLEGLAVLTLVVAAGFVADGVLRTILAFQMRARKNWGWMLAGGMVSVLAGVMLAAQFPFSALWALGVLTGINLFSTGWVMLMLGDVETTAAEATPA